MLREAGFDATGNYNVVEQGVAAHSGFLVYIRHTDSL